MALKNTVCESTMTLDIQKKFDVAVVIPTVLRPTLLRAVRSVYNQDLSGRIQILIGIDKHLGDANCLDVLLRERPENVCITTLDLGYSTSIRHGGIYSNQYSGAIRTILSYAANSRFIAYLDDDDWWGADHLSSLLSAISDKAWAFSYRWFVDQETEWPICRDEWDSLGPGRGINLQRFGGFVSPSCLLVNKEVCHSLFPLWALSAFPDGTGEDRLIFRELLKYKSWVGSEKYSVFYEMRADVQHHPHHEKEFSSRKILWIYDRSLIKQIIQFLNEAQRSFKDGELKNAQEKCAAILALNPYHAETLRLLCAIHEAADY